MEGRPAPMQRSLPPSLASVRPFLEEARAILAQQSPQKTSKKIALYCIEHAQQALAAAHAQLDEEGRQVMEEFNNAALGLQQDLKRGRFGHEEAERTRSSSSVNEFPPELQTKIMQACESLFPEAQAMLDEAEALQLEGKNQEAARKFHAATVFLQVLDSLVPLDETMKQKLHYAAWRTRLCSHFLQNFVHEHFGESNIEEIYELDKNQKLGKGSYGSVYRVTHRRTGEQYACKVINITRIGSHYLHKLHTEITILRQCDHPNIVRLKEVFFGKRQLLLVMELCTGGELFDMLTTQGRKGFKENFAARLIADMLAAVRYLHENGVVHRDLKLENFLFYNSSPDSPLKLIDFGLSKLYTMDQTMRQVVGSAYYTAPEVLRGDYDYRCDMWGIGVITYMMLTGSPPFHGNTTDDIHRMILEGEPDYSSSRLKHVSPAAIDFMRRLMERDVNLRMTSVDALEHPFIRGEVPLPSISASEGQHLAESLQAFLGLNLLKKLVLEVVAFSLPSTTIERLRETFQAIDTDRSGTISVEEMRDALSHCQGVDAADVEAIFSRYNLQHSDKQINYNEFLALAICKRLEIDENNLLAAFDTLDTNHCGMLAETHIRLALGTEAENEDIKKMIAEADTNGDGMIDYEEFVVYWRNLMYRNRVSKFARLVRKATGALSAMRAFASLGKDRRLRNEAEATRVLEAKITMDAAGVGMAIEGVEELVQEESESDGPRPMSPGPASSASSVEPPRRVASGSNIDSAEYTSLGQRPSDAEIIRPLPPAAHSAYPPIPPR